ncbi:DUF47 family protein [Parachlamydia sp. AcF125]|uniref:DUF47 domain-containing protein n=1 Tax=Parachlamydia sp. AcF125 TaxID=2795736 RepID=UPI001BCA5FAD|nr:DUF47 family protein [Parachlamydia sp. AcF125]MBS4167941.1 hypothetical protein [Parachlamydia sp. AcF125]
MFSNLIPNETRFFEFFEKLVDLTLEATQKFYTLVKDNEDPKHYSLSIQALEHKADELTQACIEDLHQTFLTPINREDIHKLITWLDGVIDGIEEAVESLIIFKIREMRADFEHLARILLMCVEELYKAIKHLRFMKHTEIKQHCSVIDALEDEGDMTFRHAMGRLFEEELDPLSVIKWKEMYEILEKTIDQCEEVANIVEGILMENS